MTFNEKQKLAEKGDIDAQYELGKAYHNGIGVEKNHKLAMHGYQIASESGHPSAQCNLGCCYADDKEIEPNFSLAVYGGIQAAEQGSPDAQYNLYLCFTEETGLQYNIDKAMEMLHLAAKNGSVIAQQHLGSSYYGGHHVFPDSKKALFGGKKAAEQGDKTAQDCLEKFAPKAKK